MQKMIATLFVVASIALRAADADEACATANQMTIVWHPTAWPSDKFIANQRINYLGRCDAMFVNAPVGAVIVRLADASQAEEIRCKYEVAGLGELRSESGPNSELYRQTARIVLGTCGTVVKNTADAGLAKSWRWLEADLFN